MFLVFIVIMIYILAFLIFEVLWNYSKYKKELPDVTGSIKIKFSNFYQLYSLNPNRWILKDGYVKIKVGENKSENGYVFKLYETCYFNFIDWKRYDNFLIQPQKINANKSTIKLIKAVQQDIDALRKQAVQEIKEASDKTIEIAERLKEK